ncbi:hypothetical protein GUJ93_ZPchr0008g11710 [Zizania palustris]|uniref:Uncharacterized protein n=1 Tax=Zizania palustris TaxID=103762 RepID=A0A8J5R6G7_ZIZPA|nr:hypothetical protein GUJ93_ZPchr0008g11710 [Zizania palustris]
MTRRTTRARTIQLMPPASPTAGESITASVPPLAPFLPITTSDHVPSDSAGARLIPLVEDIATSPATRVNILGGTTAALLHQPMLPSNSPRLMPMYF